MFFLQTLGKKINKALESKEDYLLRTNDLNEIKNYLNSEALFKLYVLIQETLKSENWHSIKTQAWNDSVSKATIEKDDVIYTIKITSEGNSVNNSKTNYQIELQQLSTSFFQQYLNKVHKEIQRKEEERFI